LAELVYAYVWYFIHIVCRKLSTKRDKKLSYRRETARQLPAQQRGNCRTSTWWLVTIHSALFLKAGVSERLVSIFYSMQLDNFLLFTLLPCSDVYLIAAK